MRPWIRRYPFSWIFAPGGRLRYEAYENKNALMNKINLFLSKSKVPKMEFYDSPLEARKDWKEKYET